MDGAKIRDFNDLIVWQKSMELAQKVYVVTQTFPKLEVFGLVAQLRRSAVSVPSNIAEGNGRRTTRDYVSFLYIARGSLAELRTQLTLARKLGNLPESAEITTVADEIGRILNGLIASLKARQRGV